MLSSSSASSSTSESSGKESSTGEADVDPGSPLPFAAARIDRRRCRAAELLTADEARIELSCISMGTSLTETEEGRMGGVDPTDPPPSDSKSSEASQSRQVKTGDAARCDMRVEWEFDWCERMDCRDAMAVEVREERLMYPTSERRRSRPAVR